MYSDAWAEGEELRYHLGRPGIGSAIVFDLHLIDHLEPLSNECIVNIQIHIRDILKQVKVGADTQRAAENHLIGL